MSSTPRTRAIAAFERRFGAAPELVARAPGRVNLIGEHVDYNEGLVLPMAIDRAVWVAASARTGRRCTVVADDLDDEATWELAAAPPLSPWARYPAGVAAALVAHGVEVRAVDAAVASDVPIGAGLSSSAALEVAFGVLWRRLGASTIGDMDLARLCQLAEADAVGVRCGLMDQFTSLHGKRDHALLLDCRSLDWRPLRLPSGTVVVIADSRVRRELAASEFNVRREQCEQAVAALRTRLPSIRSLRDVSPPLLERHRDALPELLARRARHVVEEIARVARVIPAVAGGEARVLGQAMTDAHRSGRDLYEVSCRELDLLVETAVGIEGCHGARLTGAGFGGCTVSLVDAASAASFAGRLARAYEAETGIVPMLWTCRADDGASVMPAAGG